MRAALASLAALALAACSHSERPIGIQPTPLYVRGAGSGPSEPAKESERMGVEDPHAVASASETGGSGKSCASDKDCAGRLRCVGYRRISGREFRQCLFSCLEGCPEGWSCQTNVADGPNNTCQRTR